MLNLLITSLDVCKNLTKSASHQSLLFLAFFTIIINFEISVDNQPSKVNGNSVSLSNFITATVKTQHDEDQLKSYNNSEY